MPPPSLDSFDAEQVAFAARAWTMKGEQEHRSAAVFAEAVSLLLFIGAPLDLVSAFSRVVSDEVLHTELCVRMAAALGAAPPAPRPLETGPVDAAGRRMRALRIVLVEGAIGETISSALFTTGRRIAEEPSIRAALSRILRDEVVHAKVSWEALAALVPGLAEAEQAALHEELRCALGAIEQDQMVPVLKRLERGDPFDGAWAALGVLPPELRVEAFYGALEKRVLPSLTKLGLDGAAAWNDRYR